MISYLSGKVKNTTPKYLTLMTAGGVGYKVFLNINTLLSLSIDTSLDLHIHTVVKDDAIDLYGFMEESEMEMFERLISVSGIGPRSALTILSTASLQSLASAIENNDLSSLPSVPGVGKKSLEKISLELKGKLSHFITDKNNSKNSDEQDARLALTSLGYNDKDISTAINEIKNEHKKVEGSSDAKTFESLKANEIIRVALKYLR